MTSVNHIKGPAFRAKANEPANPNSDGLKARIKTLLRERDAVLVAHYYTDADPLLLR